MNIYTFIYSYDEGPKIRSDVVGLIKRNISKLGSETIKMDPSVDTSYETLRDNQEIL